MPIWTHNGSETHRELAEFRRRRRRRRRSAGLWCEDLFSSRETEELLCRRATPEPPCGKNDAVCLSGSGRWAALRKGQRSLQDWNLPTEGGETDWKHPSLWILRQVILSAETFSFSCSWACSVLPPAGRLLVLHGTSTVFHGGKFQAFASKTGYKLWGE